MLGFSYIFLLFFIYSFIGYLCEVTSVSLIGKRINFSRGYLIGPYLPIFGFGSLLITILLSRYQDDLFVLFFMGVVICCLLEYFTSYLMEIIFKLRWWDYSNKKFNINGRVCLETGLLFGIGSLLIIKLFNKVIYFVFGLIPNSLLICISFLLLVIMIIDFIISSIFAFKFHKDVLKFNSKDSTKFLREEVRNSLVKYKYFTNRFIKSFPNLSKEERVNLLKEFIKLNIKEK